MRLIAGAGELSWGMRIGGEAMIVLVMMVMMVVVVMPADRVFPVAARPHVLEPLEALI